MAVLNTNAMVLEIGTTSPRPADPSTDSFTVIGGIVSAPMSFEQAKSDITDKQSNGDMEYADGLGLKSYSVPIEGILKNDAQLRALEPTGTATGLGQTAMKNFKLVRPGDAAAGGGFWTFRAFLDNFTHNDPGPNQPITFSANLSISGARQWTSA